MADVSIHTPLELIWSDITNILYRTNIKKQEQILL
jgi:hypothetical protein